MYVCPDCKTPLVDLHCAACRVQYDRVRSFPQLLSRDSRFDSAREIVEAYELIYTEHTDVWENQGRSPDFIRYYSGLLDGFGARRLLEVGCGEGLLLAATASPEKFATELSAEALSRAGARTKADLSIALAERLPYPDQTFDVVTSVGVMEHFIDDAEATREMLRVLKPTGHYVVLLHVRLTTMQSVMQKLSEYIFPVPHPIRFARWLAGKFIKPIHQPVQNRYDASSARDCLERGGFAVEKVIHKGNTPKAPLVGRHVHIFVCRPAVRGPSESAERPGVR